MDWMVGAAQLDAAQRRIIDEIVNSPSENHWVRGFAGSGKTIVLTHILKRLSVERSLTTCFATYTHALKEMVESGLTVKESRSIDSTTFQSLRKLPNRFDVLVADEFQDIPSKNLKSVLDNFDSLIIAADPAQRIYRFAVKENDLLRAIRPVTTHDLQIVHRINLPVHRVATCIYPDAELSPGLVPEDDSEPVQLIKSSSRRSETVQVVEEATRLARAGSPSAILLPSNSSLQEFLADLARENDWGLVPEIKDNEDWDDPFGRINDYLERKSSSIQLFGSKSGSLDDSDDSAVVYLMTYHNAKGLEFPYVFLPWLTATTSLEPMKNASEEDEARIFFVAATRAKELLHLSYHGSPHPFIEEIKELDDDVVVSASKPRRRY